jgi:chromosome segregation ATPase
MIEEITTNTEFWRPMLPYFIAIIGAVIGLIVAILGAAAIWVKAVAKKEDNHVKKESSYLDLVNNLLSENKETKLELTTLRTQLDQLQIDFLKAKEREIEREKELATLTLERDALKKELARIAGELENLRKEIQRLIDERDALNTKLETERRLRQEAEVARVQVENNLEKERAILNSQIESLQNKVAVLEQSIDLLKKATREETAVEVEDEPNAKI